MNPAFVLWFTGLPCSGKTTLSERVGKWLEAYGAGVQQLDGDLLRKKYSWDLGFTREDRMLHGARVANLAAELQTQGSTVLVSLISPYRAARELARKKVPNFIEVYVRCPLTVCETRDVKGMYALARSGVIENFTGVSDPYEEPSDPEVVVDTHLMSIEQSAGRILGYLKNNGYLPKQLVSLARL